ncbi:MAG TPA: NAD(P)-dependent oxidoreductase [Alphaproteobacteria bacterium]|nr:NAD(P)-dependent oxidoreductase [Alphaproteobacteria bacterium]
MTDAAIPSGHYVVLGASGMFGTHALQTLGNRIGVTVTAIHNKHPISVKAPNIRCVQADLLDLTQCMKAVPQADTMLLFAGVLATSPVLARDPVTPVMHNLRITTNVLEAAHKAGIKRVVWMSSTTGYPSIEEELTEERMFEGDPPPNWYALGWATRYLETLCRSYAERFEPRMVITALRPTLPYGEFDHFEESTAHFLPALIRRVVNRENPIEVWGDGSQTRDLVYVGDVMNAVWKSLARTSGYDAFNIAHGKSYSINETLMKICALDDFKDANIVHLKNKPTSISNRRFSTAKAQKTLGFEAGTSLDDGLKLTIAWYRANRPKS